MKMNTGTVGRKRKTLKPNSCPNPLFVQWLEEWRKEAADKNSEFQYCLGKAIQSLKKCPIKFNSGKECLILKNFGKQLCGRIDRKLAEYQQNNIDLSEISTSRIQPDQHKLISAQRKTAKRINGRTDRDKTENLNNSDILSPNVKKKKTYVPAFRSGGYSILITLLKESERHDYPGYLLKTEIVEKGRDLSDYSFTKPEPGSYYTAWSSMSTLINKGLVVKHGCPPRFSLTKTGEELAEQLLNNLKRTSPEISVEKNVKSLHASDTVPINFVDKCSSPTKKNNIVSFLSIIKNVQSSDKVPDEVDEQSCSHFNVDLPTDNSFECVDLTDNDELENLNQNVPCNTMVAETANSDVNFSDHVAPSASHTDDFEQLIFVPGDFEIILLVDNQETTGKIKNPSDDDTIRELTNLITKFEVRHLKVGDFVWIARNKENKELVLPYIVERKRMDDLADSIKDGRYHEQKFRLRQCGLPNVIYLIEKYGKETRLGLPVNTLHQAITNTHIVDNFFVKTTNNHLHSVMYLSILTNQLSNIFKDKTLISCAKNNLPCFDVQQDLISLMTFQEFSKYSTKTKNLKVQEMFLKHLLQLKGISVEKAVAITNKYPTPSHLMDALKVCEKPEMLLANLTYGPSDRKIGPVISKTMHQLYTNKKLN